ncbi:carboxypeptidase M32 [Thermococcus argininiproducens]|uniref:Metal-dependent carboxypeptidase n=1 Tax=Thermococcus argininiproducens TaxID=2866384 RepID=A0A9E7SD98_9EURY|nr:carboxypeptidase M32 [Thermococcus argininiproducens]USH00954.1 carboxypeptidase M32 [Thermococcus argininiproducens]
MNILKHYRKIWAIEHAQSLLGWDMEVNMPKMGITERSVAKGELSVLAQSLTLDPKFLDLVEKASALETLNDYEKGVIRVLQREIKIAKAFPPEFVRELSEVRSKATMAWSEAKEKDNFRKFEPWLDRIIELSKKAAEYLGYDEYPYDALLDLYEEGLRTKDLEPIFEKLEKDLKPILEQILEAGKISNEHPLEREKYEIQAMEEVNLRILELLGYPLGVKGRLDVSPHPFTSGFGINDVRVTTRYEGFDFRRTLLAVVHEFGHALYELQVDERFMFSPIARGVSLGIHESQSRFWENIIGRSKEFAELIYPLLKEKLPFIRNYTTEDLYAYLNMVRPDYIRVEADEVTYNMHILLRYKLEKLMINEEVKARELPELWNDELERLLGIRPKNYKEGILQDIHWAHATVGYFPTYSLGTLLAAQIKNYILKDMPDFYEKITTGEFAPIREWLKQKVHRYGSVYSPKELLEKSFGEGINPEYFIKYIKEKYLD